MKRSFLLFLSLFVVASASAQVDGLPPPPGYGEPVKPETPRSGSYRGEPDKPVVRNGVVVFQDPAGDTRKGRPETYLDLREVTLSRLTDEMLSVNITFDKPMPGTSTGEDQYSIIFFSMDLDQNPDTGKLFDKLGIDLGIKLKGYDANSPWEATVTTHTDFAEEYGISVARINYTGQRLNLVLRTAGPRKLDRFDLQIGAMYQYRSVDSLPNKPPLSIDLTAGK